ncbi:hypothetical protein UlMin_038574 [Ulmus minor]
MAKLFLLTYLVLFLLASLLLCACSDSQLQSPSMFLGRRRMLGVEDQEVKPKKKISTSSSGSPSSKNQTNLSKPTTYSTKNQTKLVKPNLSSKNQTKFTKKESINSTKIELKKLNSTSKIKKLNSTSKASSNSTKTTPTSTKKSLDPIKPSSSKNKTSSSTYTPKKTQKSPDETKIQKTEKKPTKPNPPKQNKKLQTNSIDQYEADDLVSEFADLPMKFQQSLLPDLERISTSSKAYIKQYNKEITKNFKPIVGNKYASTIASIVSFAFILIPLLLVSLVFNRIKAYFSLQKLLIFVQVYLSIYFAILCLSSLVTGLEPLRFFYATSQSTYVCLQVLQTLAYVFYLLLLLMYLILVFSADCGLGSKLLGLGQTFVGFSVGLHYYVSVFHRVVLHQPPKTNWKIHLIYATCFFVICLFANADRRKKAYLVDDGEEGKKS